MAVRDQLDAGCMIFFFFFLITFFGFFLAPFCKSPAAHADQLTAGAASRV